jgi:hypothetical protein
VKRSKPDAQEDQAEDARNRPVRADVPFIVFLPPAVAAREGLSCWVRAGCPLREVACRLGSSIIKIASPPKKVSRVATGIRRRLCSGRRARVAEDGGRIGPRALLPSERVYSSPMVTSPLRSKYHFQQLLSSRTSREPLGYVTFFPPSASLSYKLPSAKRRRR